MDRKRDPKITAAMNRLIAALPDVADHEPLELPSLVRGGMMALKVIVGFMESLRMPTADIVARLNEVTGVLTSPVILPEAEPESDEPTLALIPEPAPEPATDERLIPVGDGLDALDAEPENEPNTEPAIAADALAGPTTDIAHSEEWLARRENPEPAPTEDGSDHGSQEEPGVGSGGGQEAAPEA